ncbi:MAG: type III pantothenate kinase [Planctomycetaceae bacterium]
MSTILAVDVGNSRAKFGLFEAGSAARPQLLNLSATRLEVPSDIIDSCPADAGLADRRHAHRRLADSIRDWLDHADLPQPKHAVVAGSNPPVRDHLLNGWPFPDLSPRVIGHHRDIPIPVDVDEPEAVGIDRLLTAYAARQLLPDNGPTIVIDSGTATTVNLTTSDGTFRGGAILPGLRLSAYALHDYTARLPLIDTDLLSFGPARVDAPLPGRNTVDAMKSGLFWGQLGAIRELSSRLVQVAQSQFHDSERPLFVLTGGGGRQIVSHLNDAIYVDSLALHALAMLV